MKSFFDFENRFLTASSDEMLTRTATLKASKDWSLGKTSVKWKLQPVNYYRFVKELPMTATGKLQHYLIKEMAMTDMENGLLKLAMK